MRASRADLAVLVFVLILFIGGNVWLAGRGARQASGVELFPNASAFNRGPSGLSGLYATCRSMGIDVRTWRRSWEALPPQARVLVVALPFPPTERLGREEPAALKAWLRRGGTILVVGHDPDVSAALGLRARAGTSERRAVRPAAPTALMSGVESLQLSGERWAGVLPPAVIHAADRRGPAVASRPVGSGWVVAIADADALSNAHIAEGDNLLVPLNLFAAPAGAGPVYFDEYHHGFRERQTLAGLLTRPPALWVTLQVVFALALLLHAASRRFGPPLPLITPPARRSSSEYVAAMASLFRRAGHRRVVLDTLAQSFRRDVSRALGIPAAGSPDEFAESAARRTGVDKERIRRALAVCEDGTGVARQGGRGPGPKEGVLVWAGAELESLRREMLGA